MQLGVYRLLTVMVALKSILGTDRNDRENHYVPVVASIEL